MQHTCAVADWSESGPGHDSGGRCTWSREWKRSHEVRSCWGRLDSPVTGNSRTDLTMPLRNHFPRVAWDLELKVTFSSEPEISSWVGLHRSQSCNKKNKDNRYYDTMKRAKEYVQPAKQATFLQLLRSQYHSTWLLTIALIKGGDLRVNQPGAFQRDFATFVHEISRYGHQSLTGCRLIHACVMHGALSCYLNLWWEQFALKEDENEIYCFGENTIFIFNSATLSRGIRRAAQLGF